MSTATHSIDVRKWFLLFIILHVFAWSLAPILFRLNLPMDALEGASWGHQLQWGYDKNPFLNAWLTRLAVVLGGGRGGLIYVFSQLSVAACFWAVWRLAGKILSPLTALIAVLMLEGLQYYNFHAIDFNDNTLELSLWALTAWFFYQALTDKKIFSWCLTGVCAALGMMAKYYTGVFLFSLIMFALTDRRARQAFFSKGLLVALFVFTVIVTPHLVWLFDHDFVTIKYVGARVDAAPSLWNHLFYPSQFLWQQFEVVLPGFILLLPLCFGQSTPLLEKTAKISVFNKRFLNYVVWGPLLLTALLSLCFGFKLRAGWGQPLFAFIGVWLLAYWRPALSWNRLRAFVIVLVLFGVAAVSGYGVALMRAQSESSALFPGKQIAAKIQQDWHAHYAAPLAYVAGPRWLANNVAFYSDDKPAVYMEWNPAASAWIHEADLNKRGAVFVWDSHDMHNTVGSEALSVLRVRFPRLGAIQHAQFHWQRNAKLPRVDVWWAVLPPA